jgi:hypothetical protein
MRSCVVPDANTSPGPPARRRAPLREPPHRSPRASRARSPAALAASSARAPAARALAVPCAPSARAVPPRRAPRTAPAQPTLANPRGALPVGPTTRAGRCPRQARRRHQHDQTCSQNETMQHGASLVATRSHDTRHQGCAEDVHEFHAYERHHDGHESVAASTLHGHARHTKSGLDRGALRGECRRHRSVQLRPLRLRVCASVSRLPQRLRRPRERRRGGQG